MDDHFRFGSVFIKKKVTRLNFLKKNRNQFWFGLIWFFRKKTGSNQFGSVWFGF